MRTPVLAACIAACSCWLVPQVAQAGMPSITLHEVARMRLQTISFFLLVLLLSTVGIQAIWNSLAKDFTKLPRLSFGKALGVVILWGLLFVIVLTMISGARELMTPGAWERQGATYRLKQLEETVEPDDPHYREARRTNIERLGLELLSFAAANDGRYPTEEQAEEIDAFVSELPAQLSMRYIYKSGLTTGDGEKILALEPAIYDDDQYVLLASGAVRRMSHEEIRKALDAEASP